MFRAPYRLWVAVKLLSCLAGLFFAATLVGQGRRDGDSDLLDEVRRTERVAAQKLEADLPQALREADRLARSNRTKPFHALKKPLPHLENTPLLFRDRPT